jgi:hypothetical protein
MKPLLAAQGQPNSGQSGKDFESKMDGMLSAGLTLTSIDGSSTTITPTILHQNPNPLELPVTTRLTGQEFPGRILLNAKLRQFGVRNAASGDAAGAGVDSRARSGTAGSTREI